MSDSIGIQSSPAIGQLAGALAKAQGAFQPIPQSREVEVKTKDGRSYKFKYAPLDVILDAVRAALSSNGLAITQEIHGSDPKFCSTTLMHESGEWRTSMIELPGQAETAQQFGSQITYGRRYALQCVLGVAAESDDDANSLDGNQATFRDRQPAPPTKPQERRPPPSPAPSPPPTAAPGVHPIEAKLVAAGFPKQRITKWALDMCGTGNLAVLTADQYAILEALARAWVDGGDELHAKKFEEMKDRIAAVKKPKGG